MRSFVFRLGSVQSNVSETFTTYSSTAFYVWDAKVSVASTTRGDWEGQDARHTAFCERYPLSYLGGPSHALLREVVGVHGRKVGQHLARKGLVDLEHVDVVECQTGGIENLPRAHNTITWKGSESYLVGLPHMIGVQANASRWLKKPENKRPDETKMGLGS